MKDTTVIIWCCLVVIISIYCYQVEMTSVKCYPPTDCKKSQEICRYDDEEGCIRKYPSMCHMNMMACLANETYRDYSNYYCSMETFFCEEGYERWSIFFGHEYDTE